jgi:hypothetical protein
MYVYGNKLQKFINILLPKLGPYIVKKIIGSISVGFDEIEPII